MPGMRQEVVIMVTDEGLGGLGHFAKTIRGRGMIPVLFTPPGPDHWEAGWARSFDQVVHVDDPYDWGTLVTTARAVLGGRTLRGMFTAYDGVAISTARAARSLGLPAPMIPGLERARDKHATRAWSLRAGLPTPRFALINDAVEAGEVAARVGMPAVIKPLNGTASHLVRRVRNAGELSLAYGSMAERIDRTFTRHYRRPFMTAGVDGRFDPTRTFLVEQFVPGPEYSADIIVRQGRIEHVVLLEKFLVDPVSFHEEGFLWPATVSPAAERAIWSLVDATVHVLGVDDTLAHVEIIDGPDGPVVVEVNAGRLGGGMIGPMAWAVSGIDLAEETLNLVLGQGPAPRTPRPAPEPVAGLSLFLPGPGRIEAIEGLAEISALPGVSAVMPMCQVGDEFPAADHEIHAVCVLIGGITDRDRLADLYRRMSALARFEMAEPVVS